MLEIKSRVDEAVRNDTQYEVDSLVIDFEDDI